MDAALATLQPMPDTFGNAPHVAQAIPGTSQPAERHPAAVYLARLAPGSRRTMAEALDNVARLLGQPDARACPWGTLRYQHTQAVRAALAERYAPSTANKHLSALRGALGEAWRLGLMSPDDYQRAIDLAVVKGSTLPAGRALDAGELRALFATCSGGTPHDARDAALLAVLYGAGVRRSEAVALDLADYDPGTGALSVRHGKGNKARVAYVTNGAKAALDAWIAARGPEAGPLFCPVAKGGRVVVRRLTPGSVLDALRARAEAAGVDRFSPHDLRRSFISDLLDGGADISTVQRMAGHASVTTTQRYDRRGEQAKRKASGLLHVPYVAPRNRAR